MADLVEHGKPSAMVNAVHDYAEKLGHYPCDQGGGGLGEGAGGSSRHSAKEEGGVMGNWTLVIYGIGPHHNEKSDWDADAMAREFIATLETNGHSIPLATFTHGGHDILGASGYRLAWTKAGESTNRVYAASLDDAKQKQEELKKVLGLTPVIENRWPDGSWRFCG